MQGQGVQGEQRGLGPVWVADFQPVNIQSQWRAVRVKRVNFNVESRETLATGVDRTAQQIGFNQNRGDGGQYQQQDNADTQ